MSQWNLAFNDVWRVLLAPLSVLSCVFANLYTGIQVTRYRSDGAWAVQSLQLTGNSFSKVVYPEVVYP